MRKLTIVAAALAMVLVFSTTAQAETRAPDLVRVTDFSVGPTVSGGPSTCVSFTFDQQVFLTGGDRTNFHLVPTDGDDAADGTSQKSNVCRDRNGDRTIVVIFKGNLNAADYARGYVDNSTVSSNAQGNAPTNVPQSEDIRPNTNTVNPDLVSVTVNCRRQVAFYRFDEALAQEDVIQDTSGLRLYFNGTKRASAQKVEKTGNKKLLKASFKGGLPQGRTIGDAKGAFVTAGTVVGGQAPGGPGGENGNAFDEVAPLKFAKNCQNASGGGNNTGGGNSGGGGNNGGGSGGGANAGGGSVSIGGPGGVSVRGGSVSAGGAGGVSVTPNQVNAGPISIPR